MQTDNHSEKPSGLYHGKKTYCINVLIARKKPVKENAPDYKIEEDSGHTAVSSNAIPSTYHPNHQIPVPLPNPLLTT